jgi:hypothetical protein
VKTSNFTYPLNTFRTEQPTAPCVVQRKAERESEKEKETKGRRKEEIKTEETSK